MPDAFIYDGLRMPIGRHAGGLAPVRPDDLLAGVISAVVARSKFGPEQFEDAIIGGKKGAETVIAQDERPRPSTTYERLAELKPLFADGVVTAGNASGINDGA